MSYSLARSTVGRSAPVLALALSVAVVSSPLTTSKEGQEKEIVHGTPVAPRVGGISSLSYGSEHEGGLRVLGSVHVAPPTVLLEGVEPYPAGETVVPIAYSFLFLQDSEWRTTSDALYFRRPEETEHLGFKTWIEPTGGLGTGDVRWEANVAIRPRDDLTWVDVNTKLDITVNVTLTRVP